MLVEGRPSQLSPLAVVWCIASGDTELTVSGFSHSVTVAAEGDV
jgi:hypothetical protein